MIAASFVLDPAWMFTEPQMMTDVIGMPPTSPATAFPIPCAISSRLDGDERCFGSILSVASKFSRDSNEATAAMVAPTM